MIAVELQIKDTVTLLIGAPQPSGGERTTVLLCQQTMRLNATPPVERSSAAHSDRIEIRGIRSSSIQHTSLYILMLHNKSYFCSNSWIILPSCHIGVF